MAMPTNATGMNAGQRATGTKDIIPKGYRKGSLQQFTPEQLQLFQSLFGQLGPDSFLGRLAGGDQSMFEELEAPALKQLGEFQGGLASRFSGMGTGARRSSGHALAQGQLASDFAQQLQSQRMGLQRQALQDLMGMSGSLLQQRPYENFLVKKQMPFWKQLSSGGLEAFLGGLGGGLSGGFGGAAGGAMGGWKKGMSAADQGTMDAMKQGGLYGPGY